MQSPWSLGRFVFGIILLDSGTVTQTFADEACSADNPTCETKGVVMLQRQVGSRKVTFDENPVETEDERVGKGHVKKVEQRVEKKTARARRHHEVRIVKMFNTTPSGELQLPPALPENSSETEGACMDLAVQLLNYSSMQAAGWMWEGLCEDEDIRTHLVRLQNGCLYLPSQEHLQAFFDLVEHPNPWSYVQMIKESFFRLGSNNTCPTDLNTSVTSIGHTQVVPCVGEIGLEGGNKTCIAAEQLFTTEDNVKVFQLDGLIGMRPIWNQLLTEQGESQEVAETESPSFTQTDSSMWKVTLQIDYVVCSYWGKTIPVTDAQLYEQTNVLNLAYAGKDQCKSGSGDTWTSYTTQQSDTRVQFTTRHISRINSNICGPDINNNWNSIYSLVPRENGVVKVILASTELLGKASFPSGHKGTGRVCMMNWKTVPGGEMPPYDEGHTLTHEMGHYLGLHHTFEGGCGGVGDSISDTNAEGASASGCPSSTFWRSTCGSQDPVHNFMDYSNDRCLCTFTPQQVNRIWAQMEQYEDDFWALRSDLYGNPAPAPAPARLTTAGCTCRKTWTYQNIVCSDSCCNPDGDAGGEWCFTDGSCNGKEYGYCAPATPTATLPTPTPTTPPWTAPTSVTTQLGCQCQTAGDCSTQTWCFTASPCFKNWDYCP